MTLEQVLSAPKLSHSGVKRSRQRHPSESLERQVSDLPCHEAEVTMPSRIQTARVTKVSVLVQPYAPYDRRWVENVRSSICLAIHCKMMTEELASPLSELQVWYPVL